MELLPAPAMTAGIVNTPVPMMLPMTRAVAEGSPSERARAEALTHLDFAIAELRDMKMQPALERALRHKDVLKA